MKNPIPEKYHKDIFNAIMDTAINGWHLCHSDAEANALEFFEEINHKYRLEPLPHNSIPKCHLKTLCHAMYNAAPYSCRDEFIGSIQDVLATLQGTFFNDEEIEYFLKDNELSIKHLSEEKEQEDDEEGHPLSGCIKEIGGHKYRLEPVED